MPKIVINKCYGGFGLSKEAMLRYAELKGDTIYPEKISGHYIYWRVPKEQRTTNKTCKNWYKFSEEEKKDYSDRYDMEHYIYERDIPRDDAALVQAVEELGKKANGMCADLKVVEVPDNVDWIIEEYDGNEWISEQHRRWG